jgi:hypothetical protein
MGDTDTLVSILIERYARYRALLDQVAEAIASRSEEELGTLESACCQILQDIRRHWDELDASPDAQPADRNRRDTSWGLLESALAQAAEQQSLNQAALAQWVGEVGAALHEAKATSRVLRAYEGGSGPASLVLGAQA